MQCTWVLKQKKGIGCPRLSAHLCTRSKFSVSLAMEVLNDVDVSLTINLTTNTSHQVSEDYSVTAINKFHKKRTRQLARQLIDKGKKV